MPDINTLGQPTTGRRVCWLTDHQPMDDNRANILVARNGRWFGSAGGRVFNDTMELHGTALVGDMNAARGACGQDGTIGFWIGYPSGGDVQLVAMDATVHTIPDAYPQGNGTFAILDRFTAWWQDGHGQERTTGMLLPVMLPGDKHNRNLFRHQGRIWVAYQSSALSAIVTHPEDSLDGYVVATVTHQEPQFYLMARETAQGVVLCTSWNAEDHPRNGVLLNFDAPRVNLLSLIEQPDPTPVPDPEPEPEPEPDPMSKFTVPDVAVAFIRRRWDEKDVIGQTNRLVTIIREKHDRTPTREEFVEVQSREFVSILAEWEHVHGRGVRLGLPEPLELGLYPKSGGDRFHMILDNGQEFPVNENLLMARVSRQVYYADVITACGTDRPGMPPPPWELDLGDPNGFVLPPKRYVGASPDPVPAPDPNPTPTPTPVPSDLQQRLAAIEKDIAELKRRPAPADINGKRIALMADNGKYVCADFEKGEEGPLVANRDGVAGWETFTIAEVK